MKLSSNINQAYLYSLTKNNGPVHWIHENYICWPPNCENSPDDECCQNVPEKQACKADTYDAEEENGIQVSPSFFNNVF